MRKFIWALGADKFNLVNYWEKGLSVPFVLLLSSVYTARASEAHNCNY